MLLDFLIHRVTAFLTPERVPKVSDAED